MPTLDSVVGCQARTFRACSCVGRARFVQELHPVCRDSVQELHFSTGRGPRDRPACAELASACPLLGFKQRRRTPWHEPNEPR